MKAKITDFIFVAFYSVLMFVLSGIGIRHLIAGEKTVGVLTMATSGLVFALVGPAMVGYVRKHED